MTRDEAIAQLEQAGVLIGSALAVIESTDGGAEMVTLHALAARIGWRLEALLGLSGGSLVKAYDGTPKPS